MSTEIKKTESDLAEAVSKLILSGDLADLGPKERVHYYNKVCELVGLNPFTKPFDLIKLNGKLTLYANKGCAEQLRQIHGISISVRSVQSVNDVYVIIVEAQTKNGRYDSATGAVPIKGLGGEALANAYMRCETKAKRRVTLSICGLNMLDETEVASIPGAIKPESATPMTPEPSLDFNQNMTSHLSGPLNKPVETRESVGREIIALKKVLKLTNDELIEWGKNKTGYTTLKAFSLDQLISFRNELKNESEKE